MALLTKMSQCAVVPEQVCLQQPFELFKFPACQPSD